MSKVLEKEIYKKSFERNNNLFLLAALISLGVLVLAFLINMIVALCVSGRISFMFEYGRWYWFGFGFMIAGGSFAILFLIIYLLLGKFNTDIILTNKRLYVIVKRQKWFLGTVIDEQNFDLSTITNIYTTAFVKKNRYLLSFRTPSSNSPVIEVDKKMCDCFVDAVNSFHNPEE